MVVEENTIEKLLETNHEKDKFCPILLISQTFQSTIYSDLNNYIIAREMPGYTIWIWTKDNIRDEKIKEISMTLKEHYLDINNSSIIGKKELYEKLKNQMNLNNYFEIGFLKCKNVISNPNEYVTFIRANYGDKTTLAKYWIDYCDEMFNRKLELNDALIEVEEWLEEENFYVIKNNQGKIVAMAKYRSIDNIAEITHVYTPKEERGKGYCKNIVYYLTNMLLKMKQTPVLYTDYYYEASNKAYKKVGYSIEDNLIRFSSKLDQEII